MRVLLALRPQLQLLRDSWCRRTSRPAGNRGLCLPISVMPRCPRLHTRQLIHAHHEPTYSAKRLCQTSA